MVRTKKQIANLIVKGQEMSLTSFETQELIQASFKGISENRSNLIAANELNTAINYAQYETYVRSGVTRVRWVTVLDGRVCPICEPLHNQEMGINNKFVGINDNQIVYQGMYPPAHVRCRCYTEEVLEGFEVVNERIAWTGN